VSHGAQQSRLSEIDVADDAWVLDSTPAGVHAATAVRQDAGR
jgi:hypothetical protein